MRLHTCSLCRYTLLYDLTSIDTLVVCFFSPQHPHEITFGKWISSLFLFLSLPPLSTLRASWLTCTRALERSPCSKCGCHMSASFMPTIWRYVCIDLFYVWRDARLYVHVCVCINPIVRIKLSGNNLRRMYTYLMCRVICAGCWFWFVWACIVCIGV